MTWWYNTESGALTSNSGVQSFLQTVQGDIGLSAGWHQLSIPASDTEAQAAAAAKAAYPTGATPSTSVATQAEQSLSQETTGNPATFSSIPNAVSAFYDVLTNGKMWRSLGWLLLGLVLMLAGILLLIGPAAERVSPLGAAKRALLFMARPPVLPLVLAGTGMYLAWFGSHYWGSDTKWPSDPVKSVLQGKGVPAAAGQQSAAQIAAGVESSSTLLGEAQPGAAGAAPAVSGTYTLAELETLWTSQGGASATAFEAANVAMAESSGSPAVTSSNPDGGTNVGLWQLDTKGKGAGYTVAQLQDAATNARITVMQSANGTNWSAWADSVVTGGVYTGPKV